MKEILGLEKILEWKNFWGFLTLGYYIFAPLNVLLLRLHLCQTFSSAQSDVWTNLPLQWHPFINSLNLESRQTSTWNRNVSPWLPSGKKSSKTPIKTWPVRLLQAPLQPWPNSTLFFNGQIAMESAVFITLLINLRQQISILLTTITFTEQKDSLKFKYTSKSLQSENNLRGGGMGQQLLSASVPCDSSWRFLLTRFCWQIHLNTVIIDTFLPRKCW